MLEIFELYFRNFERRNKGRKGLYGIFYQVLQETIVKPHYN